MLGLPSTTEVYQRLPKEAFYQHIKFDAKTRQQFVSGVERITVVNVIRPDTANIADGARVHEIMVLEVVPKGGSVPEQVLSAITRANPNPMILIDTGAGKAYAKSDNGLVISESSAGLKLLGRSLDEAWDSLLSQIAFNEDDGADIQQRLEQKAKIEALEQEIKTLDDKCHKERQIARKNELFEQFRAKQIELFTLRGKSE